MKPELQFKIGSYLAAFICTCFLTYSAYSAEKRGEELSPTVWMPCMGLIFYALGLNVNVSDFLGKGND